MLIQLLALARDIISAIAQLVPALTALIKRLPAGAFVGDRPSYENVSLSLHLKILDASGCRAKLARRQVVRFTTAETGLVRDLVWGDGETVSAYSAVGARLLGSRPEGSKRALLLLLPESPSAGQRAVVRSERLIEGGLTHHDEYLEVQVERATERIALKVTFPKGRPPGRVWAAAQPTEATPASLPIRLDGDGRAVASWRPAHVRVSSTYRLSWNW